MLHQDIRVCQDTSQFKVTVGEITGTVGRRHQALLNAAGKWGAPEDGIHVRNKPYSPHAHTRGITGANATGDVRDNFGQAGGTAVQITNKGLKIIQLAPHMAVNPNPVTIRVGKPRLENAEHATAARDGKHHAAEFPKELLPCFDRNAFGRAKGGKDVAETDVAMCGKFKGLEISA